MEEFNDTINLGENVVKVLKGIYDPEIPVDIYELGLIYDVMINDDNDVKILMTLTSPNCPVAETLPQEVEEKVKSIDEVKSCEVEITFDPPWSKELMSEGTKLKATDWSKYEDKYVALYCATDAILPAWAFALVAVHLAPHALKVIQGNKELAVDRK